MSRPSSRPPLGELSSTDTLSIDLERLLKRLESSLLSPESSEHDKLRTSSYDRNRLGANVEYARTLLLRLEHSSNNIKIQTRKQATQTDLQAKRDLIKRLNQRLLELNQIDDSIDDSTDSSDEEQEKEDAANDFAPAVPTSNSIDTDTDPAPSSPTTNTNNPSGLRVRTTNPSSSSSSTQPDRATTTALFGPRPSQIPSSEPATTDQILTTSRQEQDALTSSLVSLAQSLKQSSQQFAASLESEKSVLARAEQGLDKNALGMEAAERRMGMLRRMTEGKGWWGRIRLYAIIAALWLAAFLLVFIGPKLRF